MEMFFSLCAKISLPIFGYNFYKYYELNNLDKKINNSPQINLDFMPINKDLEGRDCLFFGSLKNIKLDKKQVDSVQIFTSFDPENNKNHFKNVRLPDDVELDMKFLEDDFVTIQMNKDKTYSFYDFPALKSELLKDNTSTKFSLFDNFLQRAYYTILFSKEKK
jgi:hypothetical protein